MAELPEWRKRIEQLRARNEQTSTKVVQPKAKHSKPTKHDVPGRTGDALDVETK